MEMLDVVNAADVVIGQASKKEVYDQCLPHRIVHVYLFDDMGRLALQKRSAACAFCPLHWSMSAAGHVQSQENYEAAAQRELNEELGITLPLQFVGKELYLDPLCSETFLGIFRATANGPFAIDPKEVDHVSFVPLNEVRMMIAQGEPFHAQFVHVFNKFFS